MKHVTEFLKLFSGCTLCLFRIHYWIYAELSRIWLYKNQTCSFSSSVAEWNNFFFLKYPFHLSSKGKVPKKASFEKSARQSSDLGGQCCNEGEVRARDPCSALCPAPTQLVNVRSHPSKDFRGLCQRANEGCVWALWPAVSASSLPLWVEQGPRKQVRGSVWHFLLVLEKCVLGRSVNAAYGHHWDFWEELYEDKGYFLESLIMESISLKQLAN